MNKAIERKKKDYEINYCFRNNPYNTGSGFDELDFILSHARHAYEVLEIKGFNTQESDTEARKTLYDFCSAYNEFVVTLKNFKNNRFDKAFYLQIGFEECCNGKVLVFKNAAWEDVLMHTKGL